MYAMPTLSMRGVRPAKLSVIHCRNLVETTWFIVRTSGHGGKTAPFAAALTKRAIIATGRRGPIEQRGVPGNKVRARSQRIGDLLGISAWQFRRLCTRERYRQNCRGKKLHQEP